MPLGEDQKAMLRLLAQREQGYDDIAALMGLSVDEVRAKVKDALGQLEDEGVAPPPLPPEPPLATAAEESKPEPAAVGPEPPEPVASTVSGPEPKSAAPEPPAAPDPEPPAKPVEAEKSAAATPASPPPPKRPSSRPPKLSLPAGKGARAAIAAGVAVVILVVVVLIVSGGGGGDSSTTSASTSATTENEAQNASTASNGKVTEAVLSPVGSGSGSGVATFGRVKKSLALQVVAKGLAPTTTGNSYTIWLSQSPQRMLPLASTPAKKGVIGAQFEVPVEVLAYLANETFKQLVITQTNDKELEAALSKATKEERAPAYTGTTVLEGTITGPIVGAEIRKEEEEKEKGE